MQEALSTSFVHATYTPSPIDGDLVAIVRRALSGVLDGLPTAFTMNGREAQVLFSAAMTALCTDTRPRGIRIEQLIVATKAAWASLPDTRTRFGESTPDVLAGVITACIESWFAPDQSARAD